MTKIQIKSTTDYKKFKYQNLNRPISRAKVKNLVLLMTFFDLKEHAAIIVNEKMEVVDGQHRLEAWKELKKPVYYQILEGAKISTARSINSVQSSWTLPEFIKSYADEGNEEFRKLWEFSQKHELSITTSANLLSGSWGGGYKTRRLKEGVFEVTHEKEAEQIIAYAKMFLPYITSGTYGSPVFLRAIHTLFTTGFTDWEVLKEKLQNANMKIKYTPLKREYLYQIENIYNYRRSNYIRLFGQEDKV